MSPYDDWTDWLDYDCDINANAQLDFIVGCFFVCDELEGKWIEQNVKGWSNEVGRVGCIRYKWW